MAAGLVVNLVGIFVLVDHLHRYETPVRIWKRDGHGSRVEVEDRARIERAAIYAEAGKNCRCVAPATSFCEYADTKPRKTPIWFALSEDRPLFAFAGLWTTWRGVRGPKSAPVEGAHELFAFLTTEANVIVAPIHPKAMPVILRSQEEADRWLEADTPDALALQRPLPGTLSGSLREAKRKIPTHRRPNEARQRKPFLNNGYAIVSDDDRIAGPTGSFRPPCATKRIGVFPASACEL